MSNKLTPTSWTWADELGAGIQIYANVPFSANCVEFKTKPNFPQPVFTLKIRESDAFKDEILSQKMMLGYAQWIQFEPSDWAEMQRQNAELLITCANSCIKVNPTNTQTVAENISEMYETLKETQERLEEILALVAEERENKDALDDIQSEVELIMNNNEKLLEKIGEENKNAD